MSVSVSNETVRLRERVRALSEQLEERDAEIASLRDQLIPRISFPVEWCLSPSESAILSFLLARAPTPKSTEEIALALYKDPAGGASSNTIKVLIDRLRKKLNPIGATIHNRYGLGYYFSKDDASRIRSLIERADA